MERHAITLGLTAIVADVERVDGRLAIRQQFQVDMEFRPGMGFLHACNAHGRTDGPQRPAWPERAHRKRLGRNHLTHSSGLR